MAKRKSRKKNKLTSMIAISLVAVCLVLGFVFMIGEAFVSPDANKIESFYANNEKVDATDLDVTSKPAATAVLSKYKYFNTDIIKKITSCASISTSDKNDNQFIGTVIYVDKMGTAMDIMKAIKAEVGAQGKAVRVRGKAIYVGDKECLTLYNNVIF